MEDRPNVFGVWWSSFEPHRPPQSDPGASKNLARAIGAAKSRRLPKTALYCSFEPNFSRLQGRYEEACGARNSTTSPPKKFSRSYIHPPAS